MQLDFTTYLYHIFLRVKPKQTYKMKTINLSRGHVALVDDADYERLIKHKWHVSGAGYAVRSIKNSKDRYTRILMHREIMDAKPGQLVDHINLNKNDNRRENLRFVTALQNSRNTTLSKKSKTGFKGVNIMFNGKFCAAIKTSDGTKKLGIFLTAQEAGDAYDAAAIKYFGEFARTNAMIRAGK